VLDKKLGQLFQVGISGTSLTQDEKKFLTENNIGGVILFARNLESPEQIYNLCSEIQSLKTADAVPFIISIDMEGGRVHRLKPPFTQWPAIRKLADLDSTSLAFQFSQSMGIELKSVGINMDFAPCIDIFTNPKNEIIGDRSPGEEHEVVSKIGSALTRGYIKSDILTCAKHFPGHGNTILDSHFELPIEDISLETLKERELQPYKKLIRSKVDFIMTAHIKFSQIDNEHPVTFSKKFLKDMLKEELRFKGIIISDDLDMKAIRNHYAIEDIPILALEAGCDSLLYCNEPESPAIALDTIKNMLGNANADFKNHIEQAYKKMIELKQTKLAKIESLPFEVSKTLIGHPDHLKLAENINSGHCPAGS